MENRRDVLVLLTATYPFGQKSETFLDDELPVLARHFARVIVVPSQREEVVRTMPEGVVCDTSLADVSRERGSREILKRPLFVLRQYALALSEESRPQAYLRHPRTYLHLLDRQLSKYRALRSLIVERGLRDALFYDYWLENSTLALSWLRREGFIKRAVARAHGFDLYDERWEAGAAPFRAFKVAALDRVFAISAHGVRYLSERCPGSRGKITLSRLGVAAPRPADAPVPSRTGGPAVIVSCASLVPFKRVERVPQVLARIGRPLHWIHFGDGPSRHAVEQAASGLPPQVTWRLAGHVEHEEVFDYYRRNRVDLFISLSASEGLPVSMMEAISFGIPLLGTEVGGVAEIVTAHTGTLLAVDDSPDRFAAAARRLLDGEGPTREEIRSFFGANFEAERNFGEFAEMLHAV